MKTFYRKSVESEGRKLTIHAFKSHGLSKRISIEYGPRDGVLNSGQTERLSLCEEDVALFLQQFLEAVRSMPDWVTEIENVLQLPTESKMTKAKKEHARAYQVWPEEEDAQLMQEWKDGLSATEIASRHERQPSAIQSRLIKLRGEKL